VGSDRVTPIEAGVRDEIESADDVDCAARRCGENAWFIQAGYVDPTLLEILESEDQARIFISHNTRLGAKWWVSHAFFGFCFMPLVGVLLFAREKPFALAATALLGVFGAFSLRESRYFIDRKSKTFVIEKRIAFSWLAWKRTFPIREDFRFVVLKGRGGKREYRLCATQHASQAESSGPLSGARWLLKVADHPLHTAAVRTLAYRLNEIVEELAEDRHSGLDYRAPGD
jgi:hypothetical protein